LSKDFLYETNKGTFRMTYFSGLLNNFQYLVN
jgi:hypothetical protein